MTLSSRELLTLCQVSVLLILAEVSLRLWSFQTILHALERRCARAQKTLTQFPAPEVLTDLARLIELADRHSVFRPSCLRQALVVAWLVSGRGIAPMLHIGVAQADGRLRAHAWVESNGQADAALVALE
jgi:hypothetical protein